MRQVDDIWETRPRQWRGGQLPHAPWAMSRWTSSRAWGQNLPQLEPPPRLARMGFMWKTRTPNTRRNDEADLGRSYVCVVRGAGARNQYLSLACSQAKVKLSLRRPYDLCPSANLDPCFRSSHRFRSNAAISHALELTRFGRHPDTFRLSVGNKKAFIHWHFPWW